MGERVCSEAFWELLQTTTGLCPFDGSRSERQGSPKNSKKRTYMSEDSHSWSGPDSDDNGDHYEAKETELDNPTAQLMEIAQFARRLGGTHVKQGSKDDLSWSDEVEQLVVKFKENNRLARPKVWSRKRFYNAFRTLRL